MRKILYTLLLFYMLLISPALAENLKFSWLPNSAEENVVGYRIYYGSSQDVLDNFVDVGNPAVDTDGRIYYEFQNIPTGTVYFACTAYNADGMESDYSTVLSYTPKLKEVQEFKVILPDGRVLVIVL